MPKTLDSLSIVTWKK